MSQSTCCTPECDKAAWCRGYCRPCYSKGRRTGTLELQITTPRHELTDVDLANKTAVCGVCGPTEISVRGKKRECILVRKRTTAYRRPEGVQPRIRNTYPEPLEKPDYRLRRQYGITLAEYEKMRDEQGGLCQICHEKPKRLVVDHCHTEGHVRGLLCHRCNVGLGMFRDNPAALISAAGYLSNA